MKFSRGVMPLKAISAP